MRPVLLGSLLAAITMTKINEGIYLSTALFVATLFFCRNATRATKMLWFTASTAVILMPIVLMRHHLFNPVTWSMVHGMRDKPWILFAAIQLAAALAWFLVSSSCERNERGKTFPWRPFAAWMAPAGVVALGLAFYCVVRGSSVQGLLDGIFLRPQSLPAVFSIPIRLLYSYHALFAILIFFLVTLYLSYPDFLNNTLVRRGLYVLKIVIGIGFLVAVFDTAHGFLAAPWAWLLLIPGKQGENVDKLRPPNFAEYLLGMVTILHPLYAYPVAGSQAAIVALVVPVFGAVLARQGFSALLSDVGAHGGLKKAAHVPLLTSIAGSALVLAHFASAYYANNVEQGLRTFLRRDPTTGLPGASRLHMPRGQYAEYLALTHNLLAHTDQFLALNARGQYRLNSLYFWTRTDPPTYYNGSGVTFKLLRTDEKEAIRNALEANLRPGVVGPLSMTGGARWQGPFYDYLTKSYARAMRLGKYAIYLKKDSQPRRPLNIWLHYCPVKSRIESVGWGHRVSFRGSRTAARPVKWAFSRKG